MTAGTPTAEARQVLGIVYCPVCEQDTMPEQRTGQCFWCQTRIAQPGKPAGPPCVRVKDPATGRFVPGPVPVAPLVPKGCCLFCGELLPEPGRYKKLFCCRAHSQAHWVRYTEKGRDWTRRHNRRHRHITKREEKAA